MRDFSGVAAAIANPKDARVAAWTIREPRRQRLEQLANDVGVGDLGEHHAAGVQGLPARVAGSDAAPGDRDQPFDEGPQLLRLRHRRLDLLVTQQRDGLVPQQREPMLGDAAQFSMTYVVSHDSVSGL